MIPGKKILLFLILCCSFSFAQTNIPIEYYVNNTRHEIEEIQVFILTKSDTIPATIEKGKIKFPREFKDNFTLVAKIDGYGMRIGSYRPAMFAEIDKIVVGRITDFSTLKKSWEFKDTFSIGKDNYLITIENSQNLLDCLYSITINMVNASYISETKSMVPRYTPIYYILKRKT